MKSLAFVAALILFAVHADSPEQLIEKLNDPSPRVRQVTAETAGKQKLEAAALPLGKLLKDEDAGVRKAAADALVQIGAKAVPALVAAVGDENKATKCLASFSLGRIGPDAKDAVEVLATTLKHKDTDVRIHAAEALGKIGPGAKAALPALAIAAKDTSNLGAIIRSHGASGVAEAAVDASLKIDSTCGAKLAETVLPDLIAALKDKNGGTVQAAVSALRALGEHARPALPALEETRKTATGFLDRMIPDAIATITGDLTKPHVDIIRNVKNPIGKRVQAIQTLAWSGAGDKTVAALSEFLADPEPRIRDATLTNLYGHRNTKVALPNLLKLLGDEKVVSDANFRIYGFGGILPHVIARVGSDAVPGLLAVLEDEKQSILARYQTITTLGLLKQKAKDARPALEKAFNDRFAIIAIESACSFVLVGGDSDKAIPTLRGGLGHPEPVVIQLAAGAAARLGEQAKALVPDLLPLLKHKDREVRIAVARALGSMGAAGKEAAKGIGEMLKSKDARESHQAAEALASLGVNAVEAMPALLEAVKDPEIRHSSPHPVHETLRKLGPAAKDAVPVLMEQLKTADNFYADSLLETLGKIGPAAKAAIPQVAAYLTDKSNSTRQRAARSLGEIGPDAKDTIPAIKKLQTDEWKPNRAWAAFALARITEDSKPYVETLIDLWKSDGPGQADFGSTGFDVVKVLALLGPDARPARDMLLAAVSSENTALGLMSYAAEALGKMPEEAPAIVAKLTALIERRTKGDRSSECCRAAAKVLGALGPKAKDALPQLRRLAGDEDTDVADDASEAIKRITAKD